jgi:hypothetical protein
MFDAKKCIRGFRSNFVSSSAHPVLYQANCKRRIIPKLRSIPGQRLTESRTSGPIRNLKLID